LSQEFDFARQVVQASAVLTGDESAFTETDHHFGRLTVTLSTEIIGRTKVVVTATYGLRDYSNEWDDTYEGEIRFCLLVDHGPTGAQPGVAQQLIEGQLGGPDHHRGAATQTTAHGDAEPTRIALLRVTAGVSYRV
jgi:hypothetical protein